jgi:hypothetical protein
MVDIWGQFAAPFTIDSSAFDRELGPVAPTPHEAAVTSTVAWFSAERSSEPPLPASIEPPIMTRQATP